VAGQWTGVVWVGIVAGQWTGVVWVGKNNLPVGTVKDIIYSRLDCS